MCWRELVVRELPGPGRMSSLSAMIVEKEACVIPPLPDCETMRWPDDRMFSKAQDDPLRVHFDLTSAESDEALHVARLLAANGKIAAVVHGESDAWPTGGLWPPTSMSQFSAAMGCTGECVLDGVRGVVWPPHVCTEVAAEVTEPLLAPRSSGLPEPVG